MRHVGGRTDNRDRDTNTGERGETLLEILITVMLMGIAVVGILAGLFSVIRIADRTTRSTQAANTAQSFAENLKQPVSTLQYVPCATGYPDFAAVPAATYTAQITKVERLSQVIVPGNQPAWTDAPCAAATDDRGLQRLTITVTSDDGTGPIVQTLRIVKRDARCSQYSSLYANSNQGPC